MHFNTISLIQAYFEGGNAKDKTGSQIKDVMEAIEEFLNNNDKGVSQTSSFLPD